MTDNQNQPNPEKSPNGDRSFTEELEVAGDQLVRQVRELIAAGNVRRIIVRNPDGRVYMEIPLTVGVIAGGAFLWFAPVMSSLGAIGALIARLRIEIVRDAEEGQVSEAVVDTGVMFDDMRTTFESVATSARRTFNDLQDKAEDASSKKVRVELSDDDDDELDSTL